MKLTPFALIGSPERRAEACNRLGVAPDFQGDLPPAELNKYRLLIDLNLEDHTSRFDRYRNQPDLVLVGAAVKCSLISLIEMHQEAPSCRVLGINSLPGFLDRDRWEISHIGETEKNLISQLADFLGVACEPIQDRVGMIAPRVLFLLMNEAFLLEQEGSATRHDIDVAMKLGTNYPFGPFEWAEKIGLKEVVATLEAMFADTGDQRFVPVAGLRKAAFLR
ncbi:MAG: 3-hydroxyacyl-CoA dehydrogenase family protein [Bacteroidia bacterium]|nr:3-hydroxyacyl-CoA dehydrogenase family protein [Bacteroidia bacterium]